MDLQTLNAQLTIIIELIKQQQNNKQILGILTQKELLQKLNIAPNTLKSWESLGLPRLEPPIEGTRTVFYQISDVIDFLSGK